MRDVPVIPRGDEAGFGGYWVDEWSKAGFLAPVEALLDQVLPSGSRCCSAPAAVTAPATRAMGIVVSDLFGSSIQCGVRSVIREER